MKTKTTGIVAKTERITCPLCQTTPSENWAEENGYVAVKCKKCGLVYVNPRPVAALVQEGVETGIHKEVDAEKNAIARRIPKKVDRYKKLFGAMFKDVFDANLGIRWLDVGAGYGEVVEAITAIAPEGSIVEGIEPMTPKAEAAKKLGLKVREGYVEDVAERYDFASLVNVFSHIPDFALFLRSVAKILRPGGELFLETGNVGDLAN